MQIIGSKRIAAQFAAASLVIETMLALPQQ